MREADGHFASLIDFNTYQVSVSPEEIWKHTYAVKSGNIDNAQYASGLLRRERYGNADKI